MADLPPRPGRYVSKRDPLPDRLWAKVWQGPVPEFAPELGPCWIWHGRSVNGRGGQLYGVIGAARRNLRTHRVAWELEHGPIPDGLELDHLCRVTLCCRPSHLEPVTRRENVKRMNAALRHEDQAWRRSDAVLVGLRRASAARAAAPACRFGHEYTPENTAVHPNGVGRECRECRRKRDRERKRAARQRPSST